MSLQYLTRFLYETSMRPDTDSSLKPPKIIERITGNIFTESALTAVVGLTGGPLAALLPVLSKSLAAERQRKRVEEALLNLDAFFRTNEQAVRELSDAQYKLVNEAVLAVLHTTSKEKLALLRCAVTNAMSMVDVLPYDAAILSRIVRDISAEESSFLARSFGYEKVRLVSEVQEQSSEVLQVLLSSPETKLVSGLMSLGILASGGSAFEDLGQLRFMPISAKVLALLREPVKN